MWDDWLKFQAAAARRRREEKKAAEKAKRLRKQKIQQITQALAIGVVVLILWILMMVGIWIGVR